MIARTLVTALFLCLGGLMFFAHGAMCRLGSVAAGNAPSSQVLLTSAASVEPVDLSASSRWEGPMQSSVAVAGIDRVVRYLRGTASAQAPLPSQVSATAPMRQHALHGAGIGRSVAQGFEQLWLGLDHLLFSLCLLLLAASARSAAIALAAFGAALALSLSLATSGVFQLPSRGAELLTAASLVWIGGSVLLEERRAGARLALPAAVFGLVHGFGLAPALRAVGVQPLEGPASVFGFNLGLALALLLLGLSVWALVRGLARLVDRHRLDLLSAYAVACLTGALGVYWMLERAGLG